MWFKNLRVYKLTQKIDLTTDRLENDLQKQAFQTCGNLDFSRYGWVPPLGRDSELLTHSCNGQIMLCARKQEKIIPPAAINEIVEEKAQELESANQRAIFRKERMSLKDDAIHSILPRALTRSVLTYAYIDPKQMYLIIDAASVNKAEEFLDHLRATLGVLPVLPLSCLSDVSETMTRWVKQSTEKGFELDDECELRNQRESRNIVRCKNQELESDEILSHIKAGKRVIQLALNWKDALRFVLTEDFVVKRLNFDDVVQEQAQGDAEDKATQFDQDFAIMSLQINQFLEELLGAFGGIDAH
ncbi:MAG: recombination-associated protein RdgC [Gammaproteobacteria bacterium]|nr:recombination-associated protein RdgC [Gammaproteobacteria bacterium]